MAIEQWGFFRVSHLLSHGPSIQGDLLLPNAWKWHGPNLFDSHPSHFPMTGEIQCFNSLGLSRIHLEPRPPACKANALPTEPLNQERTTIISTLTTTKFRVNNWWLKSGTLKNFIGRVRYFRGRGVTPISLSQGKFFWGMIIAILLKDT